ncbi:MAG TPA: hypothetical protein DHV96_03020 [Lachnospiraceae bacterium]|nr:hypothetical protein [Lachnospiraceae bacterium]
MFGYSENAGLQTHTIEEGMVMLGKGKSSKISFQVKWLIPWFMMMVEMVFHVAAFGKMDGNVLNGILFALPFSFFVLLVSSTHYRIWNRVARGLLLLLMVIYGITQLISQQVFGNFLSLKSIAKGAGQAMDFRSTILQAGKEKAAAILCMVLLWIVYVVIDAYFYKKSDGEDIHIGKRERLLYAAGVLLLPVVGTVILMTEGAGFHSAFDTKVHFHRTEQSMYKLGMMETFTKDVVENVCDGLGITERQWNRGYLWVEDRIGRSSKEDLAQEGRTDKGTSDLEKAVDNVTGNAGVKKETDSGKEDGTSEKKEIRYHEWNIDFTNLAKESTDEELKEMHSYFSSVSPTAENSYTGMFEGYNLIYITAESFSDVVIDKERTPVLYQMWKEGVQFENFYTPSWYLSTIDGEYVNCLGQIPVDGDWSLEHASEGALPMALGNQLQQKGYVCNAYHDHDSYYYDRTKTHPKLGYTFKAVGAGLTFESMYPESDLELMEITADEYVDKAPFHTYYMTMSGHLPYTYGYNSMAVKNREVTEGMELTENAACYLEANQELEYALEYLINQLKRNGQLEHTLFVVAPDHYPYGLKKGAYDELRKATGHVIDENDVLHMGREENASNTGDSDTGVIAVEQDDFELYRNTCLIWSAAMENMDEFPLTVKKCCSNLDLLPTISNLMGLDYDSRLLAGRDMLSDDMGLVMFKDQSFLTDRVRYNATTGEAVWTSGTEDESYLQQCMQMVEDRFRYSALVLQKDYYSIVKKYK